MGKIHQAKIEQHPTKNLEKNSKNFAMKNLGGWRWGAIAITHHFQMT